MTDPEQRWALVGQLVRDRMLELGIDQGDLASLSRLSRETVRPFTMGKPNRRKQATRAAVSRVLWERVDAIDRILNGEPPVPVVQSLEFADGTTIEFDGGPILDVGDRVVALVSFPRDDPRLARLLELYPEADRAARLEEKVALLEQMVLDAQDRPERGGGGAVLHAVAGGKGSGKSETAMAAKSGRTSAAREIAKSAITPRKRPSRPKPPAEDE